MKKIIKYSTFSMVSVLIGCAAPPLQFYTLGTDHINITQNSTTSYSSSTPVIYISQITVPDYLNTTDIITRRHNSLHTSTNGRMSSILSVGTTELITQALSDKNPSLFITNQTQVEPPTYQIFIHITRFDVQNEANQIGKITLEANWSIVPKNEKQPIQKKKVALTLQGSISNDSDTIKLEQKILMQLTNLINDNIHQLYP